MTPWLTLVGLGEDGAQGLSPAARAALAAAEVVMGPHRHLALLPDTGRAERIDWPVPFADGLPLLLSHRGRPTVALASGDPFWFGAGSVVARALDPGEWRALPGPSVFSLAAARLGWPLESTPCLGLHAGPLSRLRPHLHPGARLLVTLRDGDAVAALLAWLDGAGAQARVTVLEALGGPRERVFDAATGEVPEAPVAAAIEVGAVAAPVPLASGRPDALFAHDGQITKAPMRALTLSALAPRPGERLWDIGSGSGSVAIEWLLSHPTLAATAVERHPARADRIRRNADALGQDRLAVVEGAAPEALADLPRPDAVFVGGGLSGALLSRLSALAPGARLVANAVTLETEALILDRHARMGGELLRVQTARPEPIGRLHGWSAAFPLLQWSVTL